MQFRLLLISESTLSQGAYFACNLLIFVRSSSQNSSVFALAFWFLSFRIDFYHFFTLREALPVLISWIRDQQLSPYYVSKAWHLQFIFSANFFDSNLLTVQSVRLYIWRWLFLSFRSFFHKVQSIHTSGISLMLILPIFTKTLPKDRERQRFQVHCNRLNTTAVLKPTVRHFIHKMRSIDSLHIPFTQIGAALFLF